MNNLFKFFHHKFRPTSDKWYPFIAVFYVTYKCDFSCFYCSNGAGLPYHTLPDHSLPVAEIIPILKAIRLNTNALVITGGEPLLHPEIDNVLEAAAALGFKEIVLTTNGYYLEEHLAMVAKTVTTLVVSLDTLNEQKADDNYGKGTGVLKKILANIELARTVRKPRYRMTISSVVTPKGIPDLYEVFAFVKERNFTFACAPQLVGVKAAEPLVTDSKYKLFYNFLIKQKSRANIFGTRLYLSYMRDFKKFTCKPFTMLVISPQGDIFYPCLEIGHYAGKIQECKSLHEALIEGRKKFGDKLECANQCHSACALGFGLLFEKPLRNMW